MNQKLFRVNGDWRKLFTEEGYFRVPPRRKRRNRVGECQVCLKPVRKHADLFGDYSVWPGRIIWSCWPCIAKTFDEAMYDE